MSSPEPAPVPKKPLRVPVRIPSATSTEWFFRLLAGVLLVGASLVGWSFFQKLPPWQKQSRELGVRVARLESEVDELERTWEKSDAERVTRNFGRINSCLFSDETTLASWLAELKEQSVPLALGLKADFGAPVVPHTHHQNLNRKSVVVG